MAHKRTPTAGPKRPATSDFERAYDPGMDQAHRAARDRYARAARALLDQLDTLGDLQVPVLPDTDGRPPAWTARQRGAAERLEHVVTAWLQARRSWDALPPAEPSAPDPWVDGANLTGRPVEHP